jgi:predicted lipoprotein with Yx(FWY)xxD motif
MRKYLVAICAAMVLAPSMAAAQLAGGAVQMAPLPLTAETGVRVASTGPIALPGPMILIDRHGMTLYHLDEDYQGRSICYAQCQIDWPPLLADVDSRSEGEFSIVERTDFTRQWAYKGRPLYRKSTDLQPGDMTGEGFWGVWSIAVE